MKTTADAKKDFIEIVKKSWTWKRLTDDQKEIYLRTLELHFTEDAVKGTYSQRMSIYQLTWSYFLTGISTESYRFN